MNHLPGIAEQIRELMNVLPDDLNDAITCRLHKACMLLLQENERITKERDELGEVVKAAVIPCHVCMKNGCECNVTYFSDFATGEMVAKQYNELQQLREELEQAQKHASDFEEMYKQEHREKNRLHSIISQYKEADTSEK